MELLPSWHPASLLSDQQSAYPCQAANVRVIDRWQDTCWTLLLKSLLHPHPCTCSCCAADTSGTARPSLLSASPC